MRCRTPGEASRGFNLPIVVSIELHFAATRCDKSADGFNLQDSQKTFLPAASPRSARNVIVAAGWAGSPIGVAGENSSLSPVEYNVSDSRSPRSSLPSSFHSNDVTLASTPCETSTTTRVSGPCSFRINIGCTGCDETAVSPSTVLDSGGFQRTTSRCVLSSSPRYEYDVTSVPSTTCTVGPNPPPWYLPIGVRVSSISRS